MKRKSGSMGLVSFTIVREDPPRERNYGVICLVSFTIGREDSNKANHSGSISGVIYRTAGGTT